MSIQRIPTITCSLNLGFIYSIDYIYSPRSGITITIFFASQSGEYQKINLLPMQKHSIRIGTLTFSMIAKSFRITKERGKRVMAVDFVDETFTLQNYWVTLTGKGCGYRIYPLGRNVDSRTDSEKILAGLDPVAEKIKNFTEIPDVDYSFDDFLAVLRQNFNVSINATYDKTVRDKCVGSFDDVLRAWCGIYNLAFFFENGVIKIYDPTKLQINLPNQPTDATNYEYSETIEDTQSCTVSRYVQLSGGEKEVSQAADSANGPFLVKTNTLFPIGYEFGLVQTNLDLTQVAAAMYGKEFWFLYNVYKNTLSECGWTKTVFNTKASQVGGWQDAYIDEKKFSEKYEAYRRYGETIAGRWYLSNNIGIISAEKQFTWFDETDGQSFNLSSAENKLIEIDYLTSTVQDGYDVIKNTQINQYFPGINFNGNRMVFYDTKDNGAANAFILTSELIDLVNSLYSAFEVKGSSSMDYSQLIAAYGAKKYVSYKTTATPAILKDLFDNIGNKLVYLQPRKTSIRIKGVKTVDYNASKESEEKPDDVQVIRSGSGNLISNVGIIQVKRNGSFVAYYDKYEQCASAFTAANYFKHNFDIKEISVDNAIQFIFKKIDKNTYSLTRDFSKINNLVNNPYLPKIAQARNFTTKSVSFSMNNLYDVPLNFLTNGLIEMSLRIGDAGLSANYSFSNNVLKIKDYSKEFQKFEQQINNSWKKSYSPKEIIK